MTAPWLLALAWASAVRAEPTPIVSWDLEQDDGGFSASGDLGQWMWGPVEAGPGASFDGTNAWGIGLSGGYLNDSTEYLEIPLPTLAGVVSPVLRFAQWYQLGAGDAGHVEIDSGGGWTLAFPIYDYPAADGWSGASSGWMRVSVPLVGLGDTVRVRLVFASDATTVGTGWYVDEVGLWDGDVTAPQVIALDVLVDTENLDGPYVVRATAIDDTAVDSVILHWELSSDAGSSEGAAPMTLGFGDEWRGTIPGQAPDTVVSYWVEASDGANAARSPESGSLSFRVYLPAPTDLVGPEGRIAASTADISWAPPVSTHAVLGYRVERGQVALFDVEEPWATVELLGSFDEFDVRALYAEGAGDASESLAIDAVIPTILSLDPDSAWPGEAVRTTLYGAYLLLVDGEVTLDFGEGTAVEGIDVRDVDHLLATVRIDGDAIPGERTVSLSGPTGAVSFEGGFTVRPESDRPLLLGIHPERVTQGDAGELVLRTQGEIGDVLTASLGEGIVVGEVRRDGDTVTVAYAVATNAPIGEHPVTLDDGTRMVEGVSLTVRDYFAPAISTCAVVARPTWVAWALAALAARRRRR